MPLFSVDIQKRLGTYYWTNRYVIQADDLTLATNVVPGLVDTEKMIHATTIFFDKARVSDFVAGNDNFIIVPLSGNGEYAVVGDAYPMFNVVRVDLRVAIGRPSRKYYRTGFGEGEADGDHWSNSYYPVLTAAMVQLTTTIAGLVDVDGQLIVGYAVPNLIGMRQQRRGSKRKLAPVI